MRTQEEIIEMILMDVEYKIRKNVKETVLDERDDLSQDMKIKIMEKIKEFLAEETIDFVQFVELISG